MVNEGPSRLSDLGGSKHDRRATASSMSTISQNTSCVAVGYTLVLTFKIAQFLKFTLKSYPNHNEPKRMAKMTLVEGKPKRPFSPYKLPAECP